MPHMQGRTVFGRRFCTTAPKNPYRLSRVLHFRCDERATPVVCVHTPTMTSSQRLSVCRLSLTHLCLFLPDAPPHSIDCTSTGSRCRHRCHHHSRRRPSARGRTRHSRRRRDPDTSARRHLHILGDARPHRRGCGEAPGRVVQGSPVPTCSSRCFRGARPRHDCVCSRRRCWCRYACMDATCSAQLLVVCRHHSPRVCLS